jgi:hypothetical protein
MHVIKEISIRHPVPFFALIAPENTVSLSGSSNGALSRFMRKFSKDWTLSQRTNSI